MIFYNEYYIYFNLFYVITKKRKINNNLNCISTSTTYSTKCDISIAKFIYGCNIPFSIVSHPLFKEMIHILRPG